MACGSHVSISAYGMQAFEIKAGIPAYVMQATETELEAQSYPCGSHVSISAVGEPFSAVLRVLMRPWLSF
jgi:hypothetical protein